MSPFSWTTFRKGDRLPAECVLAGETGTDGHNYVCRVNGEAGKVNCKGDQVNQFWCSGSGCHDVGDILCVSQGFRANWKHQKRGEALFHEAVLAGSTKTDGENYVARHGGAAGKVNLDKGKVWSFWVHGAWTGEHDGDVLCIEHTGGHGGGGGSAPAMPPAHHGGGGGGSAPAMPPAHHGGGGGGGGYAPAVPGHQGGHWNPAAMCDGVKAEERAKWLVDNKGMSHQAACGQVMQEFPDMFKGHWSPGAMCDGVKAEDRAKWLVENKGLSHDAACAQVMQEFPTAFSQWWAPHANCDGTPAEDRAKWLMQHEGYTEIAARLKVKGEFPHQLHGPGHFASNGKFQHALSVEETPEGPRLRFDVVMNIPDVRLVAVHYQVNGGAPMNFDIREPQHGTKTYVHVTPPGGGHPLCRVGDEVSYWLAAEIKGLMSEDPEGACPNPAARLHWRAC